MSAKYTRVILINFLSDIKRRYLILDSVVFLSTLLWTGWCWNEGVSQNCVKNEHNPYSLSLQNCSVRDFYSELLRKGINILKDSLSYYRLQLPLSHCFPSINFFFLSKENDSPQEPAFEFLKALNLSTLSAYDWIFPGNLEGGIQGGGSSCEPDFISNLHGDGIGRNLNLRVLWNLVHIGMLPFLLVWKYACFSENHNWNLFIMRMYK